MGGASDRQLSRSGKKGRNCQVRECASADVRVSVRGRKKEAPSAVPVFLASAAGASETSCCSEVESFPGEFKAAFASAVTQLVASGAASIG